MPRKHIPIGSDVELDAEITRLDTAGSLPPGGLTGEVLTKASDADGDADWEAGGGGLPDPFVVTGTDPDAVTATVEGAPAQQEALLSLVTDDDGSNFVDLLTIGGPNLENNPLFNLDSSGTINLSPNAVGATPLLITADRSGAVDEHMIQVGGIGGTAFDVQAGGRVGVGPTGSGGQGSPAGLVLHGPWAAPPDNELNAGQLTFWIDRTNGAAKLMIKAKSADGTVVTGEVALT